MSRKPGASIVANPVLVGAITQLVVTVAVFLAYNANNGLPFVPARTIYVEMVDGADVNQGVEVREGGFRIGIVEDLKPQKISTGRIGAVLQLKLDQSAGPFPRDSKVLVRPRSPLALKIVEFQRGRSKEALRDGERIRATNTTIATDLDELYSVYDVKTREGSERSLMGYGAAFAGRGRDLNQAITDLPRFFGELAPVMRNLASEETDLDNFFKELGDFTRVVAPVADRYARSFRTQADTFEAIGRDPEALKATISKSPPTLDAQIRSFRVQRPFLRDTALFSRELDAASDELRGALPVLNQALEVGTPVTRRSVQLNEELQSTMSALEDLVEAPATGGALRALTATVTTLQPQLRFLGPYVTVCNYWNIFWTFAAEHLSTPDPTGSSQRVLFNSGDDQNDELTSMGANEFVTGKKLRNPRGIRQYLHGNTAGGNAIAPDGTADCTPGQQGYAFAANRNDDTPDKFYRRAVVDQLNAIMPGSIPAKGPTFNKFDKNGRGSGLNRPRVPKGQTFTDVPGGRAVLTDFDREILAARGQAGR